MKIKPQFLIQLAFSITAFGYAFMHFFYRGFNIWKIYAGSFVKYICRNVNIPMTEIFDKGQPTKAYLAFLTISGSILLIAGLFSLFQQRLSKSWIPIAKTFYGLAGFFIILHAFSAFVESKLHYNVLFEYTVRIALPFLCIFLLSNWSSNKSQKLQKYWLPLIIGLTFFAHGLYALRFFPIPQNFLMMTANILKTPRGTTFNLLYIVGFIDIILLIGIFIKRLQKPFIYYAIIWGFLTALARLVAYYNPSNLEMYLTLWIPEFLIRSGHYLLPFALLLLIRQKDKSPEILNN